jgi:perosamine synthetase
MSIDRWQLFRRQLSEHLSIDAKNVFFFWKGRVALYAILKAVGVKKGDEIILPAFACVVAVNPIIYLGAQPIYVDIDPTTYNIDTSMIERKITERTRAILAQNTFGLAPDLERIFEVANRYRLMVIEDCAHGFGGFYKGRPNGTIADASFFSSQWNKPFSTGIGGFAVTKDPRIAGQLKELEETFTRPSLKDEMVLKALLLVKERLNSHLYWPALKAYRWLAKNNLILGSSQGEELECPVKPKGFEKGFSQTQAGKGKEELSRFQKVLEHRKEIANAYRKTLLGLGIEPPYEPEYAEHTYLKFPLLVKDRLRFFRSAQKEKIELGDWFLSPIHPIIRNFGLWYYWWGENPIAEKISRHIVNLPNHTKIDKNYVDKVTEFLKKNRENMYTCHKEALRSDRL